MSTPEILTDMPDWVLADTLASIDAVIDNDLRALAGRADDHETWIAERRQVEGYRHVRRRPVADEARRREIGD